MKRGFATRKGNTALCFMFAKQTLHVPAGMLHDGCAVASCKTKSCASFILIFRGVAQLVARLLWEQDAGCSSHLTPTR